jgi:large subunit ribosomal protein L23
MALFGSKKTTKTVAAKADKKEVAVVNAVSTPSAYDVTAAVIGPRITEKATMTAEKGVYIFNISTTATKPTIANAIKALYGVTPVKVRVAVTPAKQVIVRGKKGMKSGVRKAYVYLKAGDKIELA